MARNNSLIFSLVIILLSFQLLKKEEVEEKAMEKKVIQLCEEAKRGAEAALMEAEKAWTAWCIDALDQLNKSDITCPLLVSTQVSFLTLYIFMYFTSYLYSALIFF